MRLIQRALGTFEQFLSISIMLMMQIIDCKYMILCCSTWESYSYLIWQKLGRTSMCGVFLFNINISTLLESHCIYKTEANI